MTDGERQTPAETVTPVVPIGSVGTTNVRCRSCSCITALVRQSRVGRRAPCSTAGDGGGLLAVWWRPPSAQPTRTEQHGTTRDNTEKYPLNRVFSDLGAWGREFESPHPDERCRDHARDRSDLHRVRSAAPRCPIGQRCVTRRFAARPGRASPGGVQDNNSEELPNVVSVGSNSAIGCDQHSQLDSGSRFGRTGSPVSASR